MINCSTQQRPIPKNMRSLQAHPARRMLSTHVSERSTSPGHRPVVSSRRGGMPSDTGIAARQWPVRGGGCAESCVHHARRSSKPEATPHADPSAEC